MTRLFFAALVAASMLAGCGGGGNGQEATIALPIAPVAPTLPAVIPDVTFTQVATNEVVTPGEAFRPGLIAITCPLMKGTESCEKTLPLGEVGVTSDLALQDLKLSYNGRELQGFFLQEGTLYRFTPAYYIPIWQPGALEVKAISSPSSVDGAKTTITMKVADASIDKTMSFIPAETKVTVKALAHNAPAIISPIKLATGMGFSYFCPTSVSTGCQLGSFSVTVNGAAPGSDVQLSVGGLSWYGWWTDTNGSMFSDVGLGYVVQPGETVLVQVLSKPGQFGTASVSFQNLKSWSGDKLIAPLVPPTCTLVSQQYCKG